MRYCVNFEEALLDSPIFRKDLYSAEISIQNLQIKFEKLIYQNHLFQEASTLFNHSMGALLSVFAEIGDYFDKENDDEIKISIKDICEYFKNIKILNEMLINGINKAITKNISTYVNNEIKPLHDHKKCFDKLSEELDVVYAKNSQIHKSKTIDDSEESCKILKALKSYFAHSVLDYAFQINKFAQSKRLVTSTTMKCLVKCQDSYFEGGYFLLKHDNLDKHLNKNMGKELDSMVNKIQNELNENVKNMEERHALVKEKENDFNLKKKGEGSDLLKNSLVQGYLFKRTTGKFKCWNRRWFTIKANQLIYCKRKEDFYELPNTNYNYQAYDNVAHQDVSTLTKYESCDGFTESAAGPDIRIDELNNNYNQMTTINIDGIHYKIMESDLRLCSVKAASESIDRRFCFEIISPSKSHILQADTEKLYQYWVQALQEGISSAYVDNCNKNKSDSLPKTCTGFLPSSFCVLNHSSSFRSTNNNQLSSNGQISNLKPVITDLSITMFNILQLIYKDILGIPGNEICCDCSAQNPEWASINLGITLCIECSGIHRSLGVHKSKVRSLYLDTWELEYLKILLRLGNKRLNKIYLSNFTHEQPVDTNYLNSRERRENYIKSKYVDKIWVSYDALAALIVPDKMGELNKTSLREDQEKIILPFHDIKLLEGTVKSKINLFQTQHSKIESSLPLLIEKDVSLLLILQGLSYSIHYPISYFSRHTLIHPEFDNEDSLSLISLLAAFVLGNDPNKIFKISGAASEHIQRYSRRFPSFLFVKLQNVLNKFDNEEKKFSRIDFINGLSPFHLAALIGNCTTMEFFLLNNTLNENVRDINYEFTPLHLATINGNTSVVCQLIKRGADIEAKNVYGLNSLTLAVASQNADIVTLLRISKLRLEGDHLSDDLTFSDVINDLYQRK